MGTLKVEHYAWSWAQWVAEWLKNIALPLALGFVGYLFQRRLQTGQDTARRQEKELEEARLRHERELASKREADEKVRAERAETLRIMLPKI